MRRPLRVLGAAAALAGAHPGTLPAATGVVMPAAVLALLIHPVLVPVLVGYGLFALHVVVRRTTAEGTGQTRPSGW